MSAEGDRLISNVYEHVVDHLFGASLALASIVSGQRIDDDVAQRLVDVIGTLDIAERDLRVVALARVAADHDDLALETSPETTISPSKNTPPTHSST